MRRNGNKPARKRRWTQTLPADWNRCVLRADRPPHTLDEQQVQQQRQHVHRRHQAEVEEDVAAHVGHVQHQAVHAHGNEHPRHKIQVHR